MERVGESSLEKFNIKSFFLNLNLKKYIFHIILALCLILIILFLIKATASDRRKIRKNTFRKLYIKEYQASSVRGTQHN